MKIIVKKNQAGQRLDKFLIAGRMSKLSRQQIQSLIKQQSVTVNDQAAKPHYLLKLADIINVKKRLMTAKRQTALITQSTLPSLKIIAQTDEYLVIDKPAGLAVHGQTKSGPTLADCLVNCYPSLKKIGDDPERPGIVHRLDKDVSGLMVIAKNQAAFDNLKEQFQQRKISKKYMALAYGKVDTVSDTIAFPIARSSKGFKMAALPLTDKKEANQAGRQAITEFRVIKQFINYTLLEVTIKTGRTHQIRVHLAAYGHPLVGDNIYGTAKTRLLNKKINLARVFLVATELGFSDMSGKWQQFSLDLPEQLRDILKQIK